MLMLQGSFFKTSSHAYSTAPRSICLLQVQHTALPKIDALDVPGYSENFQEIPGRWYGENEASEAKTVICKPMQLKMEKVATQAIHHVLVLVP